MPDILGQNRAIDILRTALRSGRVHHAWIFSGPRGVGKFTTAIEVARLLLDPEAVGEDFPLQNPESRTQNLIAANTHPDLHIVRKELSLYSDNKQLRERKQITIPIDLLRERIIGGMSGETYHDGPAYRKAAYGHGKVFIIDEAELLDVTCQNMMLKTLEEPPPETYFFLITSQPDELLPTIRSRCQHVRFGPLDDTSMRAWVKRSAVGDQRSAEQSWVEQFAEGSPGIAQLAMEYGFHNWQSQIGPMLKNLESGKFTANMGETLNSFVQEFAEAWVKNHRNASKDAANKDGVRHVLSLLGSYARQRMAESVASRNDQTVDWPAIIDLLRDAERNLDSNVNIRMLLENLVAQWARVASVQSAITYRSGSSR